MEKAAGTDDWWARFERWPLRDRLELLAFEARLARVRESLIQALWEAIDHTRNPGPPRLDRAHLPATSAGCTELGSD
jgi:hypothetical protein